MENSVSWLQFFCVTFFSAAILSALAVLFLRYPDHDVFRILGEEELELTVPIKLHGDEGRSTWTKLYCLLVHLQKQCPLIIPTGPR